MPEAFYPALPTKLVLLLVALGIAAVARADDPRSDEFFEKGVRPVLAGTCFR